MFTHLDDPAPPTPSPSRRAAVIDGVRHGRRRRAIAWSSLAVLVVAAVTIGVVGAISSDRSVPLTTTGHGSKPDGSSTPTERSTTSEPRSVSLEAALDHLHRSGGLVYTSGPNHDLVIADPPGTDTISVSDPFIGIVCGRCGTRLAPDKTALAYVGYGSLIVLYADGSKPVNVAGFASDPAWSPDSSQLAFDGPSNNPDVISVVNRDGRDQRALGPGRYPAWSADGTQIYFTNVNEPARIMRMDADGTHVVQITKTTTEQNYVAPSPDGHHLAFLDGATDGIAISNLDGTDVRQLTSCERPACSADLEPTWSPDSTQIAYLRSVERDPSSHISQLVAQVWIVTLANPTAPVLVTASGDPCCLSWR